MLRQVADELGDVRAAFGEAGHPGEAGSNIAGGEHLADREQLLGRDFAQQAFGGIVTKSSSGEDRDLLQRANGVAHPALRALSNQRQGLRLGRVTLLLTDIVQPRSNLPLAEPVELELLTARLDSVRDFMEIRGTEHKQHMRRRLFQGL